MTTVMITGGAGFIGSTIASACLDAGITPVIVDDLSTGREEFTAGRTFYRGDIASPALLDQVFADHPEITLVVHCAARISVPESVADPLGYYRSNVMGLVSLLDSLDRHDCRRFLFSSSASIYAPGENFTVDESSALEPTSPYARTKQMCEQILTDTAAATLLRSVSLRYFNPIGADPRLRTGLPSATPSHALGKLISAYRAGQPFTITGVDWPTRDGTTIRDYIHVWDLARAHVAAIRAFATLVDDDHPATAINIGTGHGTTVRELVDAFNRVADQPVEVIEAPPRPGDAIGAYTRSDRARRLLGWEPEFDVEDGIRHALAWADRWLDRGAHGTP
jgi:UDP-glucose 4-epimerase